MTAAQAIRPLRRSRSLSVSAGACQPGASNQTWRVFGEVLQDHRPVGPFEQPSAAITTRRWNASSSGSPNRRGRAVPMSTAPRGGRVFSICARTEPSATLANPRSSSIWASAHTARVQRGQTGLSRTASIRSCRNCPAIWSAASVMPAGSVEPITVKWVSATPPITPSAASSRRPVDRIDDVHVALKPGAVEIDRDMADQYVAVGTEAGRKRHSALPNGKGLSPRWISAALETIATRRCASGGAATKGCGVETRARNGQHGVARRLRYVLKSSHDLFTILLPFVSLETERAWLCARSSHLPRLTIILE